MRCIKVEMSGSEELVGCMKKKKSGSEGLVWCVN